MKRISRVLFSVFVAGGLVLTGGLYDAYAESPSYKVTITDVARTEVEVKKPEKIIEKPAESVEIATTINRPTYTAPVSTPAPHYVGPDMSNHLEMPSIGVYRAVQTVGINGAGEVDVPASNVGMWNGGAMPGQNGVVFLDGHVSGVFSSLRNTSVGSEFSLTWGGVVYRYRVSQNSTYALSDLNNVSNGIWAGILRTPVGGTKGLNIMTCAGTPQGSTYSHRTVVYAYQIN